jgi:hypothetical protein
MSSYEAIPMIPKIIRHLSMFWLLLGFMFLFANCAYATTVTKTPISSTSCTTVSGIGTASWSRASRAISSNNSYATTSLKGTTSKYLRCLNYGFAIPVTATINGITVNVERKASTANGDSRDAAMRIVKGGTIGTFDRSTTTLYTSSDITEAHGSATDLWGLNWTVADINAVTFGAAFAAIKPTSGTSQTISVDVISITVDYTVDTTSPTVSSIKLASVNPTGAASVAWTVVFSESVTGVDVADFALAQAGGVSSASITSVTGSGSTWTVNANSGNNSGTLGLNLADNDTILDLSSNKLGGTGTTGSNNGSFTGQVYTIDKINPTVITVNLNDGNPSNATSVAWTVVFNKSVTGVDATDFSLTVSGLTGTSLSVTGNGATYIVTANTGSGSGTLGLNLVDNDTIIDATSHPLGGTGAGNANFTGQVYRIDRTAPSVISINRADNNPSNADNVSWTVIFSESVTGTDVSDFTLAASNLASTYIASVSGSGTTWLVVANTGICSGTCTLGLNLVDDDTIIDEVGNKLGSTGLGNGNFTGQVYDIKALPDFVG